VKSGEDPRFTSIFTLMSARGSYWKNISVATQTLVKGLQLTGRHIFKSRRSKGSLDISSKDYFSRQQGITTVQFPHETLPVPDVGRYQLHNEIDDCIVCDKCVKICPVNCIVIEPIRSAEEFGKTSDGTSKRIYAATFDIDMGKCCFCGLCTTVCPTECLTMTKTYDFSVLDINQHNFSFANLTTTEIKEKKEAWDQHQQSKAAAPPATQSAPAKPVIRPSMKPPGTPNS
jgi:formate hydrogenlyase subunit 6/NADH:ubiquinone oxidoreductase subunit I